MAPVRYAGTGQRWEPPRKLFAHQQVCYEDERALVYRQGGRTVVRDKRAGREITLDRCRVVKLIRNKPAGRAPLAAVPIQEGIKLANHRTVYIVELRPGSRLLSAYPNPRCRGDKIIIRKKENVLYFYKQGELYKSYPVATGKHPRYTPEGSFAIVNKIAGSGRLKPQLGDRWMGLGVPCARDNRADGDARAPAGRKYGIHGTDEPASIGEHASGGCIRMDNDQVKELFDLVEVGVPVLITD